jgi:hypothetical protein
MTRMDTGSANTRSRLLTWRIGPSATIPSSHLNEKVSAHHRAKVKLFYELEAKKLEYEKISTY